MKIPYNYKCAECDIERVHWAHINDQLINHQCPCGYKTEVMIKVDITRGLKLLYRAGYEINRRKDNQTAIIISAMAFETEQLRLYRKWHSIEKITYNDSKYADKEVREIFRQAKGVKDTINKTIRKITDMSFNEYIARDTDLVKSMKEIYPEFNGKDPLSYFHKIIFKPRNDIIHGCYYSHSEKDAVAVYNMAYNGVVILHSIDKERRNKKK